jgi:nitrogen fixation/metabolism regulation signal transduction histidine kinase
MQLNQMKIGPRLALGFGVVVALMLAIVATTFVRLVQVDRESDRMAQLQQRAMLADGWRADVELNASRALAIAKSNADQAVDAHFAPLMRQTSERISERQKALSEVIDSEQGKTLLGTIAAQREAYVSVRRAVLEAQRASDEAQALRLLDEKMIPASQLYVASIEALSGYQQNLAHVASEKVNSLVAQTNLLLAVLSFAATVGAVLGGWLITRSVLQPVRETVAAAERIAGGDLSQPVTVSGRDEMADMLRALSRMQDALGSLVGNVRASSDSIGTASAQIASGNQTSPAAPSRPPATCSRRPAAWKKSPAPWPRRPTAPAPPTSWPPAPAGPRSAAAAWWPKW